MRMSSFLFLIVAAFVLCDMTYAAQAEDSITNIQPNIEKEAVSNSDAKPLPRKLPAPKTGTSTPVGWLSSIELWLSLSVLSFGLIALFVEVAVIKSGAFKPDDSIKLLAVTLIVISTLFIITAGFDSEQIAPAMGLFGTVAGYMLGKTTLANEG